MKKIGLISAMLFLFGMSSQVMAQNDHSVAKDNQKNQAQLTLSNGDVKYYNTEDVQSIDIKDKQVRVAQAAGNDVFDNQVTDISFFKAQASAAEVTKADLIGLWEVRGHEESGEDYFALQFTEDKVTIIEQPQYGDRQELTIPYTLENGVLTYMYPATEWSEAYTESKNVSLLYDKSVLLMKYIPEEFDIKDDIEMAEIWYKEGKNPDTSKDKLDGKWFCYHRDSREEVNNGLIIKGDKAEFIIGAWSTRMVGTYTYENGVLYLHPTEYYIGRDEGMWGYGYIDPATLESPVWYPTGPEFPETFMFIVNGDEAYGWYANQPRRYYRQ